MSVKHRPTPLLGIPLGAPPSAWSSPVLPQLSRPHSSPPGPEPPDPQPPGPGQPNAEQPEEGLDLAARVELLADRSRHRLTPMDVQNRRFARVRQARGYDMRQVDGFMDEVQAELVRLHQHIQQLQDQQRQEQPWGQDAARAGTEGLPDPDAAAADSSQLGRVRVMAVRVAADILADALCQAEEIYRRAYQQAAELVADATHRPQPPVPSATNDATAGDLAAPAQSSPDAAGPTPPDDTPAPPPTSGASGAAGAVIAGPWDAERDQP